MIFRQIIHDDLGCASYLIGDKNAGLAAVVDPRLRDRRVPRARPLRRRLDRAHPRDAQSRRSRFRSWPTGRRDRRDDLHPRRSPTPTTNTSRSTTGSSSRSANSLVRRSTRPVIDLSTRPSPLIDRNRGAEPWVVLTGDTLFVNDVARPDLAIDEREGASGHLPLPAGQAPDASPRPAKSGPHTWAVRCAGDPEWT